MDWAAAINRAPTSRTAGLCSTAARRVLRKPAGPLGASDRDFCLRSVGCWDGRGFIPAKRRHRWAARSHSRLGALSGRVCVSKKLSPERWRRVAVVPQRASGQAQPFTRFAGPDQQTLRPAAAPIRRATPHPDGAMQVGGTQGRARQPYAPPASGGDEVVFIGVAIFTSRHCRQGP